MNSIKNIFSFTLFFILSVSFAFSDDNKESISNKISETKSTINNIKNTSISNLENKINTLTNNYSSKNNELGYDIKDISYLAALGEIGVDYVNELINDYVSLKGEITKKTDEGLNQLSLIEDKIKFKAVNNNADYTSYNREIENIKTNFENVRSDFNIKINSLENKNLNNLEGYKNTIKNAYDKNSSKINDLKNFVSKYDELFGKYSELQNNYPKIKNNFLTFSADLKNYTDTRKNFYTDRLKTFLTSLRDKNFEANKTLKKYEGELNNIINKSIENFTTGENELIEEKYGIIFSENNIDNEIKEFEELRNKFYDENGILKAVYVLDNYQRNLEIIEGTKNEIIKINTKISDLLNNNSTSSLENTKNKIESDFINYYNQQQDIFKNDLLSKMKEKLDITLLENKNAILAADAIDLKFSLLLEKIGKIRNQKTVDAEIMKFKKDLRKYDYLKNDILDRKVLKIEASISDLMLKKELRNSKYRKYKFDKQKYLNMFQKLKTNNPDNYLEKLRQISTLIDDKLDTKLNTKARFDYLNLRKTINDFLIKNV